MMNKEQLADNLKTILIMEWYGIHIEDKKEIGYTTHYYVSVPESSTIETADQELNNQIKTSDGLISAAKNMFVKMLLDNCKSEYADEDDIKELMEEVTNNISDYIKIYVKVRKGEVWTKEMAEARIKELKAEIQQANQYKEV